MREMLQRIVGVATRRPARVVAAVAALAVAAAVVAALRLEPSAATDTLVDRGSDSFMATERYSERFGDDAIVVLVRGDLDRLVLTSDLGRLLGLEGCMSGNAPAGVAPPGGPDGPCARLAADKPVKIVYGPGTFINESVRQLSGEFSRQTQGAQQRADQAAAEARKAARKRGAGAAQVKRAGEQARQAVQGQFTRQLLQVALRYGLGPNSMPRLDSPDFVSRLVFDPAKPAGTPKARFAYLFPSRDAALVQVRLKPGLTDEQRQRAIDDVRAAVAMPDWKPRHGARYVITGVPVLASDLTESVSRSILVLLIAAGLVMLATLALVFRARRRLLPLAVALAAAALTFGALGLIGAPLTMASIAVLPVLIGLAVDYAIQLHARVEEERRRRPGMPPGAAARRAAALGAPTVVTAAAATAAGFMVLALSPVPMVRGFGLLLVVGIALALACALTAGIAALVLRPGNGPLTAAARGAADLLAPARRGLRRGARALRPALSGAGDLLVRNRAAVGARRAAVRGWTGALGAAVARPRRVLGIALGIAVVGWALDTQTRVESDVQKLVPQDMRALTDLRELQEATGVGGQIDVVVESDRLTSPEVVAWMTRYQEGVLKRFGYTPEGGCAKARLCPAFSLPDLFRTGGGRLDEPQIRGLLDAVPAYFSQGVITADRRAATMSFGIRLMDLSEQKQLVDEMRGRLDPPAGARAELVGLPVLAAEANAEVASHLRRLLTLLAGLLAVAAVLFVAFRDWRRVAVPLVPIALATGWSALVLFALRIPLNPMSVTLGALVIAITTEFSVLLAERYRQERRAGHPPAAALQRTYRSTGAAVVASGLTAIAGFAVLMVSDIRMLRDFGFVTVVDLSVSLLGVLLVLPAALIVAERPELLRLGGLRRPRLAFPRPRRPRLTVPRLRRRRRAGAAAAP